MKKCLLLLHFAVLGEPPVMIWTNVSMVSFVFKHPQTQKKLEKRQKGDAQFEKVWFYLSRI